MTSSFLARARRWPAVGFALQVRDQMEAHRVVLLSAGVAFYAMLALVPGLIALVSVYGLVADPGEVERQVRETTEALPEEARALLVQQLRAIVGASSTGLGFGAVVGVLIALVVASSGMRHLVNAIGVVYGDDDKRGAVAGRGLGLALTVGAVAFVAVSIGVVTVIPAWLADTGLGTLARVSALVLRWPLLGLGLVVGIGVLYRLGPQERPASRWMSRGALVAAGLWLVISILFSVYTSNFGRYNETYGSLGAVVVLLLWLQLTALSVLVGAEVNVAHRRRR